MWMGVGWYRPTVSLTDSTEARGTKARLDLTVLVRVDAQQEVHLVGLAMLLTQKGSAFHAT